MIATPSLRRCLWSSAAFVLLAIAACGGRASGVGGSTGSGTGSSGVAAGAATGSTSDAVSGSTSGTTVGPSGSFTGTSGAGTSGAAVAASGTTTAVGASGAMTSGSGTMSSGTSSGALGVGQADAGPDGRAMIGSIPSTGCGKPWAGATNMWVAQPTGCPACTEPIGNCAPGSANNQGTAACQVIPPGSTVPARATQGSPEYRGWWVYVPQGYDASKPYTVIYETPGCYDPNYFHAGADGYPYFKVDDAQAILVGLDYDTFSEAPDCSDARDPESNDFVFMPWLMNEIESTFCVDTGREWISEYNSGEDSLAQQFDCAFPARLRGQVLVGGNEPGSPFDPYLQVGSALPACNPAPMAAFFVHDLDNADTPYRSILPGCSRVLQQNGCSNTTCDPSDTTLTTPYPVPANVNLQISNGTCVKFNGCPDEYPVVFCTTNYAPNHDSDDQYMGVVPLFWDFMNGLPPASAPKPCPAGEGYQDGTCAPCAAGEMSCKGYCVNEQNDTGNCGVCGMQCASRATCSTGACMCPASTVLCGTACVDEQVDAGNCGACGHVCPELLSEGGAYLPPLCKAGVCSTVPQP